MKPIAYFLAGFVAGSALGAGIGYFLTEKKLRTRFDQELEAEVHAVKNQYRLIRKENITIDDVSPELATKIHDHLSKDPEYAKALSEEFGENREIAEARKEFGYSENAQPGEERNLFRDAAVDPDEIEKEPKTELDILKENRTADEPYIITIEEFSSDKDYGKVLLCYYEGDDVVTDEANIVVPDVDRMIGNDALTNFGKFSGDMEIVYIRNERIDTDFEIIREARKYTEAVMGIGENKNRKRSKLMEDDE